MSRPIEPSDADWRLPFDEPIRSDRPDFTEATSVVPRGRLQLESGYTLTYDRADERRSRSQTFPEFLLRTGLARDWELRVGWDGFSLGEEVFRAPNDSGRRRTFHVHDDAGTDMRIGFKTHLFEQAALQPEFSVIGTLSVPTGREETHGGVAPELKLLWGFELSERVSLSGNVNFAALSDDDGRFLQTASSVSLGYALTDFMGSYVEYFGMYPNARDRDCAHYLNSGLTFPITGDFQLDFRVGFGLNDEADDLFTGIGFAFRF